MSGFTVIDNTTGNYPDCEKIALTEDWAKHLIYCDIDTFAINEDGNLILIDDCGNCAFCPADRFTVVFEKQIPKKPTPHKVEVEKIKIGNANWGKGTTIYKCPCCNEFISRIYDYCYKCGQALDWSDTE